VEAFLERVVQAWPGLDVGRAPYGTGLINVTLAGTIGPARVIVQRVHPAFAPSVHEDIEAITAHLERKGVLTPRLVRTRDGALCALDPEGRAWRVLTFIEGSFSHDRLEGPEDAREAGRAVGVFHAALEDSTHAHVHTRPGIHDVAFRSAALQRALEDGARHRLYDDVAREVDAIRAHDGLLLPVDTTPARHAHGDLKASNVLFDGDRRALCLVDLDTLAKMARPFELGDAIRSWCNPRREDEPGAAIDLGMYEAALAGYRRGAGDGALSDDEIDRLPRGVLTIASELAMRFLTDALEERYFSFDPARFPGRGEHNLARARGQVELSKSIVANLGELERAARAAFQ
jgi:Ser/Thr protein kinase RdoA (MazF antagonist)